MIECQTYLFLLKIYLCGFVEYVDGKICTTHEINFLFSNSIIKKDAQLHNGDRYISVLASECH